MNDNDTTQWSEGLRFAQFQKNRSHHRIIDQPPYKALFAADPNIGLSSFSMPKELLPQLETEEDLEQYWPFQQNPDFVDALACREQLQVLAIVLRVQL
jgi:hypothetical protein